MWGVGLYGCWATYKMKQITFILVIIILGLGCSEKQQSNSNQIESKNNSTSTVPHSEFAEKELDKESTDTILERNNPKSLDLSKHQIFIDTTRNSEFYDNLKNWSESKWDIQSINSSLKEINKGYKPIPIDLKDFPTHFITLRKLNGDFVLYDRCDGIDPRFEIRDTAFIFYGPLESDAETILNLITLTDTEIKLELKTYKSKSDDQKSFLTIDKLEDTIYRMTYKNGTFDRTVYLTTVDKIKDFDMVVNNCPTMKMLEFDGFDKKEK